MEGEGEKGEGVGKGSVGKTVIGVGGGRGLRVCGGRKRGKERLEGNGEGLCGEGKGEGVGRGCGQGKGDGEEGVSLSLAVTFRKADNPVGFHYELFVFDAFWKLNVGDDNAI